MSLLDKLKNLFGAKPEPVIPYTAPIMADLPVKWPDVPPEVKFYDAVNVAYSTDLGVVSTVTETPAPKGEKEKRYAKSAGSSVVEVDTTVPTSNVAKLAKKPRKSSKR